MIVAFAKRIERLETAHWPRIEHRLCQESHCRKDSRRANDRALARLKSLSKSENPLPLAPPHAILLSNEISLGIQRLNSTEMNELDPLSELAQKVMLLCTERKQYTPEKFVSWLYSYALRGQEILAPTSQPGLESDIRQEYNRFGTGVSGQRVIEWTHTHKIVLPKNQHWWFIRERQAEYAKDKDGKFVNRPTKVDLLVNPPRTASISGVPNSAGIPRITNGIDVYIERPDGTLFLGHRDNLIWDRKPKDLTKIAECEAESAKRSDPLDDLLLEIAARTL